MEMQTENCPAIDFCRLCLRIIIDAKISFEDTYVLTIVKNFFPRLDLNLFEAPLICKICLEDLITAFKVQKLISNKLIVNKTDTKLTQNLCFLCLTPQKIRKIAKKNSDVRIVLDKLFQNLHLNVKPTVKKTLLVCPTCTDIANGIIGSLEHLLHTDLKISRYCKKYKIDKVDKPKLQDLHRYVNDLSDDPLILNNDVELSQTFSDLKLENGELIEPLPEPKEDPLTITEPDPVKDDVPLTLNETDPLQDVPELVDEKDFKENAENIALEETELIVIIKYKNEEYYVKATRFKNTHFQTCPVCSHSTARLVGHMKREHSKGYQGIFFKCPLCPYQTKNKGDLRGGHALTHKSMENSMFECPHCEYKAKRKPHLERHILALHNDNPTEEFSCPVCPYKTKLKAYLQSHAKVHQNPDSDTIIHKCPHCLYQTIRKKHLTRHLNIHKDKAELVMLKCPHCRYETFDKNHLKSHMKCKHTDPEDIVWFQCDFCMYKTKYKSYIAQHVALTHTNKKHLPLLKCLQCNYSTTQKGYLKNHIAYTHQGMEPFKCTKCSFTTKCKSYFNKHVQIKHEKVEFPKFTCQICQYETISKGRLKAHLTDVHDAGKRYRCGTCSAVYKYKGDYMRHLRKKGHAMKKEK